MDEMDRLLDAALAAYTEEAPPEGLNRRILARVECRPKTRRWWLYGLVPTTALLAIAFWPHAKPETPAPPVPVTATVQPEPPVIEAPEPKREIRHTHVPLVAPPEPPTPQQLALARLAKDHPELARPESQRPLIIEPLEIKPLEGN